MGRSGKFTLLLLSGGGILLTLGHFSFISFLPSPILSIAEYLFFLVLIGVLRLTIGLIWFGILNLRQPVLRHWQWLPLATDLLGFIGFFLFGGEVITVISLLFHTLFALGLIGLGLILWPERPVQLDKAQWKERLIAHSKKSFWQSEFFAGVNLID